MMMTMQCGGKVNNVSWQTIAVERVIKRSDYDTNSVNNDIALLRLAEVMLSDRIIIIVGVLDRSLLPDIEKFQNQVNSGLASFYPDP